MRVCVRVVCVYACACVRACVWCVCYLGEWYQEIIPFSGIYLERCVGVVGREEQKLRHEGEKAGGGEGGRREKWTGQ